MSVPRVNRAAIEEADLAAIVVTGEKYGISVVAAAIQMRDGRIVYNANDNRGVTLQGGLVYTTLGFGENLQAVEVAADDPLVTRPKPEDWPARVTRTLRIAGTGPAYTALAVTCDIRRGVAETLDIVQARRETVAMTEICETENGERFANQHFVDPVSGEVWRSLQWTGPDQGYILVDVVEPFTG